MADTYLFRRLAFRGPVTHLTGRLFEYREHGKGMHEQVSWQELMTTEEPRLYAALLRDPSLPDRVRAGRRRLESVLAVHRARAAFAARHYGGAAAGLGAAVRCDPRLWQRDHALRTFARDYVSARAPGRRPA
jgi:hypothetical protein